jgi:hypothetical protein
MKRTKHILRKAAIASAGVLPLAAGSMEAMAAPPYVVEDEGAYVRMLGNPADGTAKFQFGWEEDTPASDAAGYWVGVYDVTNSTYVWNNEDTGPISLPDEFRKNAKPTSELPDGDYKVVLFVRDSYEPTTNIAEIEVPFTVMAPMD